MRMEIQVTKSTIVKPSEDTPKHQLWISNLDLVVEKYLVPTIYFYEPIGSAVDSSVLIDALSKALVLFYPLAGRLGEDENNRLGINCNGEGALFVEAETDASIADFRDQKKLSQLIPTVDGSKDLSSGPLLLAQATFFACGGISLGILIHHTVLDGTSAFHFINTWSDMARGLPPSVPPFFDRTLLRARDPPNPEFHHIEFDPAPTMTNKSETECIPSTMIFTLTLDQINTLKTKANKDGKTRYTSYEILTAHIWRCMCKARGLSDDQPSKLFMPVDGRSRLRPRLPPGYLGNAVFIATPISSYGDIISNPLTHTIEKIHSALKRMDDDYLRSALDFLEVQPDLAALQRGSHIFRGSNLKIVSWVRLPMHDADFGWGKPIFMGRSSVPCEGSAYILPSISNDGSLSLTVSLEPSHMELFEKFVYEF